MRKGHALDTGAKQLDFGLPQCLGLRVPLCAYDDETPTPC